MNTRFKVKHFFTLQISNNYFSKNKITVSTLMDLSLKVKQNQIEVFTNNYLTHWKHKYFALNLQKIVYK